MLLNPAKGDGVTQEEIQQYEELNKERGIPTENTEDLTETGKAKRTTGIRNKITSRGYLIQISYLHSHLLQSLL